MDKGRNHHVLSTHGNVNAVYDKPMRAQNVKVTSKAFGEVSAKLYTPAKKWYTFGGFMVVSMASLLEIRRLKLSARDREVLDCLMLHVEFGNAAVGLSSTEIAAELGTSVSLVSRCLTKMEDCDLIERGSRGVVYMNPNFWFKGTAEEQGSAVFRWHQRKAQAFKHNQPAAA